MDYSCIFYIWLLHVITSASGQNVTVDTNIGTIIGELYHGLYNGTSFTVTRFLGIPFAEAPTGERRFQKPVKKAPFTEPFLAKTMPPACIQYGKPPTNFSEDCLYLNILVPGDKISSNNRKAVLIWIYGGGFQIGSQDIYTSPTFAGLNDVILVTLNYRLSIYGYLSTGESHMTGNNGLWDQHMAIQWVHDHIENFGGDPNRVTIFGESAGAGSVVFQALYKGNLDLFKGVIAQSGTATSTWSTSKNPKTDFDQVVTRTNCKIGAIPNVIKCLQNKTTYEIHEAIKGMLFYPVYDKDFVSIHPGDIFKNETKQASDILMSFGKLDFIFGVTSNEGAGFIPLFEYRLMSPELVSTNPSEGYSLDMFENIAIPMLVTFDPSIHLSGVRLNEALKKAIAHLYVDWKDESNEIMLRQAAMNLLSDVNMNADMIQAANVHSNMGETGKTFFYVYDHRLSFIPADRGFDGAAHAEELPVVFGLDKSIGKSIISTLDMNSSVYDDPSIVLPAYEILFSSQVMEYWTNFAKTG